MTVETKPTNPKELVATDKVPMHLWPNTATVLGALAMLDGASKYGRTNWREAGVKATVYYDACRRHLDAWLEGEDYAEDSEVHHLAHALACIAILIDAGAVGKVVDDRQFNGEGYRRLLKQAMPSVARTRRKYADKNPKHYTIADNPDRQPKPMDAHEIPEAVGLDTLLEEAHK
jgi:hypothetical protein